MRTGQCANACANNETPPPACFRGAIKRANASRAQTTPDCRRRLTPLRAAASKAPCTGPC
eukprot:5544864-Pleurochrysis_carterae.AAC.1